MVGAQLAAFYLVVEMVSTVVPPAAHTVTIGPMPEGECLALRLSMEAAAVPSIASVECRQPKIMMSCQFPGKPGTNYPCPVWEGPLAGSWRDR